MIRGCTFNNQHLWSEDLAHEVNYLYQGKSGITKGCGLSTTSSGHGLTIADGYFMIHGRLLRNIGNTETILPSTAGELPSYLVFEIDLSKINTDTEFLQGTFKIISGTTIYPTLIQQDLDNGGLKYQMAFAKFVNSAGSVTSLVDYRTVLNFTSTYDMLTYDFTINTSANFQKNFVDLWDGTINAVYLSIRTTSGFVAQYLITYESISVGGVRPIVIDTKPTGLDYSIIMGYDPATEKMYLKLTSLGTASFPCQIKLTPAEMFVS